MNTSKKSFKTNLKYLLYILGAILAIFSLCSILLMLSSRGYFTYRTPMLDKDINYLCIALNAEAEPVCNSNEKIYPEDFSDLIAEMFDSPRTRYQDFQHVFAPYQTKLTMNEDPDVIRASYDINRDGEWDLLPYFDGTLEDNVIRFVLFREGFD